MTLVALVIVVLVNIVLSVFGLLVLLDVLQQVKHLNNELGVTEKYENREDTDDPRTRD